MPHYTKDGVAQAIIAEGRRRGITARGIKIAIATGLVESNLTVYANHKVPDSFNYPHDAVGSDGMSVGVFQQQVVMGNGWWWGDAKTCMDPTSSAGLFFDRLAKLDYNNTAKKPGSYAQAVQQSSFPDRYDQRYEEAGAIYNRLAGATPSPAPAPAAVIPYGMPRGSNSGGYGGNGVRFPDWVYQLGDAFGVKPSTYPGHQEGNRNEAGYAPNPQNLNRGIDWAAPGAPDQWDRLTRFADYLATIPQFLEQVIWQNPHTMRSIEVAGGRHQPGYFRADLAGHRDHVHTRQSRSIPLPGGAQPPPPPPVGGTHRRGNVLWLADALRAEGLKVVEYPGWREKSNGNNFDEISGVILHHTGSNNASAASIFNGRPDLRGPLSQIHLARDGTVTVVAAGCANHAGTGALPWLPKGTGNRRTIGIEAANDGGGSSSKPLVHRSSWPDVQYDAYVRTVKVILQETGWGADRAASHQEYDKGDPATFEGKWDPGQIDMAIFRADVAARLSTSPTPGDDMAQVPQEQWDRVYRELTQRLPSRSPLRHLGEGLVDTMAGFVLNADGSTHVEIVKLLASLGHPESLALLREVASADPNRYPDRQGDRLIAQAILADVTSKPSTNGQVVSQPVELADTRALDAAYVENARLREENARLQDEAARAAQVPAVVEPAAVEQSTGDHISELYSALEKLRLADAMPIEARAPMQALIQILQTKNGVAL